MEFQLYKQHSASERVTKAPQAREIDMSQNYGVIENFSRAELRKAVEAMKKGMKVYMPTPDGNVEMDADAVEQFLLTTAGMGSDATVDPRYAAQQFPASSSIAGRPVPQGDGYGPTPGDPWPKTPYGNGEPTLMTRVGPNFVGANTDPNIGRPAPFNAPEPGRNPATGEPVDLSDAGEMPVFKSADQRHAVKKGTFAGTASDLTVEQAHERQERF